jgi:16S rRNA (adenine1518-N6/adenine1519-N6)-dimethyltransferase
MLRQSLRSLDVDPAPLLATVGIDPACRAEAIPVEGFVALANALDATPGLPRDAAEAGSCS